MVVPPNTIDFNNVWAKFKSLNENAAVFSTVVALLGLYVIGLIWARHMDKKDIVKVSQQQFESSSERAHDVKMTSFGCRCGVMTSHRRP